MKKGKKLYWVVWKQRFEVPTTEKNGVLLRRSFAFALAGLSLISLMSGPVWGNSQSSQQLDTLKLGSLLVAIPGKPEPWNQAISHLVNKVVTNLPPGGNPKIGVFDFKEMKQNQTTEFSPRLKEDFLILLSQVENLQVLDVVSSRPSTDFRQFAEKEGLDYFVRGFYKHGKKGLTVWSQIFESATGNIVSSGRVDMAQKAFLHEDLALLDRLKKEESAVRGFGQIESFEDSLDHLIALKPDHSDLNVKIWTDKADYEVGEKITFFIKAEKPCYLILFDISPDGETKVIFPNADSEDNFLKPGKTYQVPAETAGIEFQVQGPSGLERLKALISSKPGIPLELNLSDRFYFFEKNSVKGAQDIQRIVEFFSQEKESDWTEAYMEIYIYEKNQVIMRGGRKVPLIEKPKKPIDMIGTMGKEPERE